MTIKGRRRLLTAFASLVALLLTASPLAAQSAAQLALDRGTLQYRQGRYEEARGEFQRATQLDPGLLKAWENLGWACHRLGHDDEALRVWSMVLKVEPGSTRLLNATGDLLLERGQWELARGRFEESLRVWPNQARARLRLAEAYAKAEGEPRAIAFLEGSLSGDPDPALRRLLARLQARLGERRYRDGDFAAAARHFRAATQWQPDHAAYFANLGWARRGQGRHPEALEAWYVALRLDADRASLYRHVAAVHLEQNDIRAARSWYRKARQRTPRDPATLWGSAETAYHDGDPVAAQEHLRLLLDETGNDTGWSTRVTNAFVRHERLVDGIAFFEARLAGSSGAGPTAEALSRLCVRRGTELHKQGQTREAISTLERAIAADARNAVAYRELGWISWSLGQWDDCEATWEAYRAVHPDRVEPHNLLTRLYLVTGAYAEAVASATTSLDLDPDQLCRSRCSRASCSCSGASSRALKPSGGPCSPSTPTLRQRGATGSSPSTSSVSTRSPWRRQSASWMFTDRTCAFSGSWRRTPCSERNRWMPPAGIGVWWSRPPTTTRRG